MKGDFSLELYLKEIRNFALLTAEQERELVACAEQGDDDARSHLISANLRLVVNIAKRYSGCGLTLADLIAEGNIGLIYAAERFQSAKGCRFSTYATFWIKHTICRAITEKNTLIRIPAYMKRILGDCKKKNEELLGQLGHLPMVQEIVAEMNLSTAKGEIVSEGIFTTRALEGMQSLYSEQNQEAVEDLNHQTDMARFWDLTEVDWIMETLEAMEPKRAQIIKLRYGLDGGSGMTLHEVAAVLHLTKERIRQIEKETLQMLRKSLEKNEGKRHVPQVKSQSPGKRVPRKSATTARRAVAALATVGA